MKSLLIALLLCSPTFAQTSADDKRLRIQRQRAKAVAMIEQTAADAPLWDEKKISSRSTRARRRPAVERIADSIRQVAYTRMGIDRPGS